MKTLLALLGLFSGFALAQGTPPTKASFSNVLKLNAYADNWCMVYINGKLAATDQIEFLPHNVVTVSVLPIYPLTIAVIARDNADPKTGMEYTSQIGDGGFILKLSDGTVTNAKWKVKTLFKGPLNRDTKNPKVEYTAVPANWFTPDFDDSSWHNATEYPSTRVRPDGDYSSFDFTNASFIWSDDLDLDNTVIFRYTVPKPATWTKTWTADGDFEIGNIVNEARLAPTSGPQMYAVNPEGLAAGFLTRIRDGAETVEQLATNVDNATVAIPIDLGGATDTVRLSLYGSSIGVENISATIAGAEVENVSVEAAAATSGVFQYNLTIPRSLAGAGNVEVVVKRNGKVSNPVLVRIL